MYCITIHYPCQENFERFNQEVRAEVRLLHQLSSYSTYMFRFFSFASLSILWLVATIRRTMSTKEHHNQYCQDIFPYRIGVFCHKCGKDDFGGNTRSLSSHVWYCKPNKITTQSNLTRRNQQDKVAILLHDSGTDSFFVFGQEMEGSTPKCTPCATQIKGGTYCMPWSKAYY
jgi:hypothetical protein